MVAMSPTYVHERFLVSFLDNCAWQSQRWLAYFCKWQCEKEFTNKSSFYTENHMYLNLFKFFESSFVFSLPVFRMCHLVLPRNVLPSSLVKSASAVQMGKHCLSSSIISQGQPSGLVGLILCKEITWKWVMFASLSWLKKPNFYLMSIVSAPHRRCEFHYILCSQLLGVGFPSTKLNTHFVSFLFAFWRKKDTAKDQFKSEKLTYRDRGWFNLQDLDCCTN